VAGYVRVVEFHRGLSHSSNYYFVVNGDRLTHISRYAISHKKADEMIEYTVDLGRLSDKTIIEIVATNSGIICKASAFPAEDLQLEYSSRRVRYLPLSYLNNLEFTHLTSEERRFLHGDWAQYYTPIIEQLREVRVWHEKRFLVTPLVDCQIESGAGYPLPFLIPNVDARRKSLEGLTRALHQLWVATRIVMELEQLKKLRGLNPDFRQSPSRAIAEFECSCGLCSLWYEFDLNPHTMCEGMLERLGWKIPNALREVYERLSRVLEGKAGSRVKTSLFKKLYEIVFKRVGLPKGIERIPLRPDIVVLCGVSSCEEFGKVDRLRVRAVIECKNQDPQDPQHWLRDVESQVILYREALQPDIMIVASLKRIPESLKTRLHAIGVTVIDEVHPGGRGERELLELIKTL